MLTWAYPATIEEAAPGEFVVRFRDVPQAITGGSTFDEAYECAADALREAIAVHLYEGLPVPSPRTAEHEEFLIELDPDTAARAMLAHEMKSQGLTKVALANRLGQDEKAVRRMLHASGASLDKVLKALRVLGVHPALSALSAPERSLECA